MATTYTNAEAVADKLRRDVRVRVGQAEPSTTNGIDISYAGIDAERIRSESNITLNLSRFYSVPLTLSNPNTIALLEELAVELTAYNVWLTLNPTMSREDIPASVNQWKKNHDDLMEKIVPKGRSTAEAGRDIILTGESLLTGAGTAGSASVALTQLLPFGGTRT